MIIVIILSFILEGIVTNIINSNSYLLPLFTITSLVITYPYFDKEKKVRFIIISIIIGILYDIAYTNSLFINTFTFTICALLIIILDNYIPDNFFNRNGINIIMIILFKTISYILLFIFRFINFNQNILIKGIYSSLILNIIYSIILYFVCDRIHIKINNKKRSNQY